jgi:hypothetical protein
MADEPNEIMQAASDAARQKKAADEVRGRRRRSWPLVGVLGVGIGSAAVAGAVLFADRSRKK